MQHYKNENATDMLRWGRQRTCRAGPARIAKPRLRAGRVGNAGRVCGIHSAADRAQAAGRCAGLAAVLAAAVRRRAIALATDEVSTAGLGRSWAVKAVQTVVHLMLLS